MNPFKPTKIEWITFFSFIPVMGIALNYLLFGERFNSREILLKALPLILVMGLILWYLHIVTMHVLRIKLPEFRQTILRITLLVIVHAGLVAATMVLVFYGFSAVHYMGYKLDLHNLGLSVLLGVIITLIGTALWEGEYIFTKWKESLAEKEFLEQLQLQNEFESLKEEIPALEKEKKLLEVKMNNGAMSFEKLQEAAQRVNEIIVLIDKKEMRWLELSERE